MLRKRYMLVIAILIVIVAGFLLSRPAPNTIPGSVSLSGADPIDADRAAAIAAIIEQYPMLDKANREERLNQPVSSWEEWVKARTDVSVGGMFSGYYEPATFTSEEYSAEYERMHARWTEIAEEYQRRNYPVPTDGLHSFIPSTPLRTNMYEGPQTVEAIMAALDDKYKNTFSRATEMEETYPRDSFLQRVLDNGAVIKEYSDYEYWMKQRDMLLYRKDRPNDWQSGDFGIPVTTDFDEYEEGFLERQVWENNIIQQVSEANPGQTVNLYFPASHPDVYLPSIGKMTYVHRFGNRTETMGTMLTKEQHDNLVNKGIEPEDIEIVYIDEDYNVLSEKPKPANHPEWSEIYSYTSVPEGLRAPDGTIVSPERYQEITGKEMPDETKQKYSEYIGTPSPAEVFARAEAAREAVRTREVARAEFERFQNEMRQTEKFQSIAASEMSRELATQFLSKYAPKSGTDKQLQTALETMFQHGFEEGLRRLRKDDAGLAAALERQLAETHRPPKPQLRRQNTVPPKPSDTPPASDTE